MRSNSWRVQCLYVTLEPCKGGSLDGLSNKPLELEHAVATAGGNHAVSSRLYRLGHRPLKAETRVRSMRPMKADVFSGRPSCRGRNQKPVTGLGAELEREFAADDAPLSRGRFVVKIVAPIR